MARKSLSVKISEALELSERLNKLLNTLSPEIRQIILKTHAKKVYARKAESQHHF
ncbi:MAG: hypothetical protein QW077_06770 [Candidatus Caldarchaeum sp.]